MDCFKLSKGRLLRNRFCFPQLKDAHGKHGKHVPDAEAEEFVKQFT